MSLHDGATPGDSTQSYFIAIVTGGPEIHAALAIKWRNPGSDA